jgi:predicted amidophosphoribosyltransferase
MKMFIRFILEFLFPKTETIKKLEGLNSGDILERFRRAEKPPHNISAIFSYEDPLVRDTLWDIKYRANIRLAKTLSPIIVEEIISMFSEEMYFGSEEKPIVTHIPARAKRIKDKGFDHGLMILNIIKDEEKNDRFETQPDLISFKKEVSQQSLSKNKTERFLNMQDAFVCNDKEKIKNKVIVILDDITTTGATFIQARECLIENGARKVFCLAISH